MSFGEVAEWSIAAVLKTVELRGSGGSNPSLSARSRSKKVSRNRYLLFLYLWRKFTCRRRCENKVGGLPLFAQWACKGPCGEQKGWALSGATIGSVVANSPSPQNHEAKRYREIDTFCFYTFGASLLVDKGIKIKDVGVPLFAQWACKGPCGEQKGKALSGATIGSVVANSPSPL